MDIQKVEWKDEFSVNVQEIDDQHKELFGMLNIMIDNKEQSVRSKIITDTLTQMRKYSEYHFSTEESYMIKYNYPEYQDHKNEHINFIRKVAQLNFGAMEHDKKVPVEILIYLNDWLINHILKIDLKLKSFFENNKIELQ